jgi:factor associated with neutral sphingomyelinase activation
MFIGKTKNKSRFNLLLLSEGEYYFTDYSAVYYPIEGDDDKAFSRKILGRLKLCSKSLIFDPQDISLPMMKFEYQSLSAIEPWKGSLYTTMDMKADIFTITTTMVVEMKENNNIAPYRFKNIPKTKFKFSIKYANLSNFLAYANTLYNISKREEDEAEERLKELFDEREQQNQFDMGWLESLTEKPLLQITAFSISALMVNPGRLYITNKIVYFQPFNNVDPDPVEKYPFQDIVRVVKRRNELRQVGLEIFYEDDFGSLKSIYFRFKTQQKRDEVFDLLTTQPGMTKLQHENQAQVTFRWQCGLISNFDYLMYLNSLADRSFNDLSQYPVFPWIIQDYTSKQLDLNDPNTFRDLSKPIGALNLERLAGFLDRYRQIPEGQPKFLFGTHYSTPGYVLYYLVRVAPEYMLRLHNGKFDAADRLFTSISETWTNVLINPADLKELIPEFYANSEFLLNSEGIDLGVKQDGTRVRDAHLPAWATDARDFIQKHRDALECDYISEHINEWIDLVFGYKQKGGEAAKAYNLFHPLTYEGAADITTITDWVQRQALLIQINEFGQTPKQVFKDPHPKRFSRAERERLKYSQNEIEAPMISRTLAANENNILSQSIEPPPPTYSLNDSQSSQYNNIMIDTDLGDIEIKELNFDEEALDIASLNISNSTSKRASFSSTGTSGSQKDWWNDLESFQMSHSYRLHKDIVSGLQLSSDNKTLYSVSNDTSFKIYSLEEKRSLRSISICKLALSSLILTQDENSLIVGSWDNKVYVYSVESGRVTDSIYAHDDAVSCISLKGDVLASGSWDSTVKVWKYTPSGIDRVPLGLFIENESEVRTIDVNDEGSLLVYGNAEGIVQLCDIRSGVVVKQIEAHPGAKVTGVSFTRDGRIITCGGSTDGCIRVFDSKLESEIMQGDVTAPRCMYANAEKLIVGCEDGSIRFWDIVAGKERKHIPCGSEKSPLNCLTISRDLNTIVSGTENGCINVFTTKDK